MFFSGIVTYEMLCLYSKSKRYTGNYTTKDELFGLVNQTAILDQRKVVQIYLEYRVISIFPISSC